MKTNKKFDISNKQEGIADLYISLVVVLALTIFVFFFINIIADVNTRIQMDQVARKYILRMETEGYLSSEDQASLKTELQSIPSVKQAIGSDTSKIQLSYGSASTTTTHQSYGATIQLVIACPAATTKFIEFKSKASTAPDGGSIQVAETTSLGGIERNASTARTYVITKSSTAKY